MKILKSQVRNHEGDCVLVWGNDNIITNRVDGGVTGFFKNMKIVKLFGIPFRVKTGKGFME